MATLYHNKTSTLDSSEPSTPEHTPRRTTLRGTPKRALESAKKLLGFAPPSDENFAWIGRPTDVKRNFTLSEDLEWSGDAFTIGKQIGSGSFATVFLCNYNGTGAVFACKKVPLPSGQNFKRQKESLEREINVLRQCRSPYIVSYFGSFVDSDNKNMCIVMEYLAGGTLYDVIREYNQHGGLDEPSTHGVMCQVLRGLDYLHENGFMHRDLKTKNILIDVDGSTKLADFGVSRELSQQAMARSMVGTPLFMAPEVLAGEAYTTVADVWSFGICVLHVVNSDIPRRGIPVRDLMRMVMEQPAPTIKTPSDWSLELSKFVSMCLEKEPGCRASTKQLLQSSWISGKVEDAEGTRTTMKSRTIGRNTGTPKKVVMASAAVAPLAKAANTPVAVVPSPHVSKRSNVQPSSRTVLQTVKSPEAKDVAVYEQQPHNDVVRELLKWKQLAENLLDEKERQEKRA